VDILELFVAAVSGGLIATAASAVTTALQFKRENRARYVDLRRDVYARFLQAVRQREFRSVQLSLLTDRAEGPNTEEWRTEARQAEHLARGCLTDLELIAPEDVLEVARALLEAQDSFLEGLRFEAAEDGRLRSSNSVGSVDQLAEDFRERARRDLGTPRSHDLLHRGLIPAVRNETF
jgi:hypothetical protein